LEEEDLWISCNLFYFDQRISESAELYLPVKDSDVEVFSTLLSLFFKFPYKSFNVDYFSFSKVLQHSIFGNNSSLYNFEQNIIEPYTKPVLAKNSISSFGTYFKLFSVFEGGPFLQFEFKKSDFFFIRKLFKSLFLYRGKSLKAYRKRRKFFLRVSKRSNPFGSRILLHNFRSFFGLKNMHSHENFVLSNFAQSRKPSSNFPTFFREVSLKHTSFDRTSRMESRFLKFFWISFPFYFLPFQKFFFNFFPNYNFQNFFFFISKIRLCLNNFLNFFFVGHRQVFVLNFFPFLQKKGVLSNLRNFSNKLSGKFQAERQPSEVLPNFIQFSNFKNYTGGFVQQKNQDIFDVLNVNRVGVLDDLRRLNISVPRSNFKGTVFSKEKTSKRFTEKEKKDDAQEQIKKTYRNTKVFIKAFHDKRILRESNNLLELSGILQGNNPISFLTKKTIQYKRFLRRPNLRIRSSWIIRSRFFFPTVYNNANPLKYKVPFLDLVKLLEYFYFVLGNDRDLFDNAVYSLIVSTLKERFGDAIVSDLLSRQDHKQARKVSVVLHINEHILENREPDITVMENLKEEEEVVKNTSQRFLNNGNFSTSFKFSDKTVGSLSPFLLIYLSKLLLHYKRNIIKR